MKCVKCANERTNVAQTLVHESGSVKRRRKCFDCGATFSTLETVHEVDLKKGRPATAIVKPKQLYTKEDAALVHKIKTDIRRKNEDAVAKKKNKVSDYYIEDDFDGDY
jgi:transcriptional regulator NrdR family protein